METKEEVKEVKRPEYLIFIGIEKRNIGSQATLLSKFTELSFAKKKVNEIATLFRNNDFEGNRKLMLMIYEKDYKEEEMKLLYSKDISKWDGRK